MKAEYYLTIVTLINALLVIIITIKQYYLSRDRFKYDLFEKRYNVYKASQVFLTKFFQKATVELEDLFNFRAGTQDATFLFKDDIAKYLKKIDSQALKLWEKKERIKDVHESKERSKIAEEITQLSGKLNGHLRELKKIFKPYLAFKKWK